MKTCFGKQMSCNPDNPQLRILLREENRKEKKRGLLTNSCWQKNLDVLVTCGWCSPTHHTSEIGFGSIPISSFIPFCFVRLTLMMGRMRFLLCTFFFFFFSFVSEQTQTYIRPYSQWDFESRNLWRLFAKAVKTLMF